MKHGRPLPFAPHDSPWQITVPLLILSRSRSCPATSTRRRSSGTGSSTGPNRRSGCHFGEGIAAIPEPPEFSWANAAPGLILVALGFVLSLADLPGGVQRRRNPFRPLVGLTQRNRLARAGHTFLVQKYYLDHLYEKVIVHGIAHPIAQAAYWTNQHVIDGIVNGAGRAGRTVGDWLYRNVDQGSSTGRSTRPGTWRRKAATPCNLSSPARSTSTARCCSAAPWSAASCSSS